MLTVRDIDQTSHYLVANDYGDILLYTTSGYIAGYVAQQCAGIPRGLFLTVGGDRHTHPQAPMWSFKRVI